VGKEGACNPTNTKPLSKMGHLPWAVTFFSVRHVEYRILFFLSSLHLSDSCSSGLHATLSHPSTYKQRSGPPCRYAKSSKNRNNKFQHRCPRSPGWTSPNLGCDQSSTNNEKKETNKRRKTGRERGGTIHLRCRPHLAMFVSLNPRLPASPTYGCNSTGSQLKANF